MESRIDQLPLDEAQDLVRAISLIFWLIGLDDVWTREAAASSDQATRDDDRVEQLGPVVTQLDQLYGDIGALAPRLSEIFTSRDALLRERYAALTSDDAETMPVAARARSLTADERRKIRAHIDEHAKGDVVGFAVNAAYQVVERSDAERRNLRSEYDNIRGGSASEGDIDPEFEAWLAAVAFAASIGLSPAAGGIVEGIGHAVAFLVDLFS
jgi:hypothetical protein